MIDLKQRDDIMKQIAVVDRGLIERFVAWVRNVTKKFQDFMRNPEAGLTRSKIAAMNSAIAKFVREAKL